MFFPLLIWFWLWKVFWLTQLALSDILCALVERTVAVITFFWLPAPQFPLNRQGNLTFSIAGKRDSEGVGMRFPAGGSSGYDAWLCLIKDLACSQWCAPFPVWRYVWKRMNWLCPWALPAKTEIPPVFLRRYYRLPTQSLLPLSLNYSVSLCLRDLDNSHSFLSTATEMRHNCYLMMFLLKFFKPCVILLIWLGSFCYYNSSKATDEACKPVKQQLLQPIVCSITSFWLTEIVIWCLLISLKWNWELIVMTVGQ